jgi:phosphoserine phosphatase
VEVVDVEQVVIRGRLVLGVLVTCPRDEQAAARDGRAGGRGSRHGRGGLDGRGDTPPLVGERSHVTVLGAPLRAAAVAAIAGRVADAGANIDRIFRVAAYPVTAVELEVSGAPTAAIRALVGAEAAAQRVDVAVQRAGLQRRAKRLVVMDVDSTLVRARSSRCSPTAPGCGRRGRPHHRRGDARRAGLRGVAPRARGAARGPRRGGARRGGGSGGARPRARGRWYGRSSAWTTGSPS